MKGYELILWIIGWRYVCAYEFGIRSTLGELDGAIEKKIPIVEMSNFSYV